MHILNRKLLLLYLPAVAFLGSQNRSRDYIKYRNWMSCIVVVLLFYVHGKHLRSCRDG